MTTIAQVKTACREILQSQKTNGYAKTYAECALYINDLDEMRTQVLYILNNIQHWREPIAKEVRKTFKTFAGSKA